MDLQINVFGLNMWPVIRSNSSGDDVHKQHARDKIEILHKNNLALNTNIGYSIKWLSTKLLYKISKVLGINSP